MADEKTTPARTEPAGREKPGRRAKGKKKGGKSQDASQLRLRSDPRSERRYEPAATRATVLTLVGMSVGAVLAGAGTWGEWLRGEALGPHKYAPYILAAGALVLLAVSLLGQWAAPAVRVGDAGVAVEKDKNEIERVAWHDVTGIVMTDDMLTFQAAGRSVSIPRRVQPQAAARAVREARARIPAQAEDLSSDVDPVDDAAGEVVALEPPQVAGLRCKKSDKLIAFERDARLCGRCGELYHKDSVPPRCLTCEARL
jgi:hypothetical protein